MQKLIRHLHLHLNVHIWLLIIAAFFITNKLQAQNSTNLEINGKVVDHNHQPVVAATIKLLNSIDSIVVQNTLSDQKGDFEFSVTEGKYIICIDHLGTDKVYSKTIEISKSKAIVQIPDLVIAEKTNNLQTVQVSARKPYIEQKIDKTVINVESSPVSTGNTALEVLEKAPGVMVDNDGNISLKGKKGVTIMLDGKLTYLSQQQIIELLKSMNATQLSQIELITNPSSKYDAAGTGGIINIKTKKNLQRGFNGSATLGYDIGIKSRYNGSFNINYKADKFNFFATYNANKGNQRSDFALNRRFYGGQNGDSLSTLMEQKSPRNRSWTYQGFKVGMDYDINKKHNIGFMVNGNFSDRTELSTGPIHFYNGQNELDSLVIPQSSSKSQWHSLTYDVNYKWQIDTSGQELSANFDYSPFGTKTYQDISTGYQDANGQPKREPTYRRGYLPSDIQIKSGKIDYSLPLNNKGKLEFGWKSSFVTSDNLVKYENKNNMIWENDPGASNHFIYKENIHALYANYNQSLKKGWEFQIGLRAEETDSKAHQMINDSTVNRNYLEFFPSLFLKKEINKNNTINFSYSRRIDRPDYDDLNPFRYYIDDYTYGEGNPFLQPQFTQSFEIGNTYKNKLNTTINYSHTKNVITNIIKQNDTTHTAFETKDNLNTLDNISFSANYPITVTKWWTSNVYMSIFHNKYKGILNGGNLNIGTTSYTFNTTNTINLPKDLKAEISGYYNSKAIYSVWVGNAQYSVSAGLEKALWDKKLRIRINVNDIFNTNHYDGKMKYQNIDMDVHNRWESRRFAVSFTYNFGNHNLKTSQPRRSGIEDEQNRINK